jgi:hypothetical protein
VVVVPAGLLSEVTVAVRLTVAPAAAGLGVAVRVVDVESTPGGGGVGAEEPPQPMRKETIARVRAEVAIRMGRLSL